MVYGDCDTAHCLESHLGVDRTRAEILVRFYRENVGKDTKEFVFPCDRCQKVDPVRKINVGEFHPVPVPNEVMDQTGVDITNLPKTDDGYCCCNGLLFQMAKGSKDHTAESVGKFLFEDVICQHGCIKIQIKDQR
ncbi:uncharacterized protein LOC106870120 [Octopus bimaculoides]|uniref:uncharacterized protein LOC106870120 n=1 Tax=Octopus bimaculoides TaxID=37653 RepID=UPI00071E389A|nr:uncharacterized protein LOC106870120 [Octopus bimaculoides]|eukprot:XP_014771591.1 PREDICTED: uncharacterized protein LOC106870120 [Octopus bimaculoides]